MNVSAFSPRDHALSLAIEMKRIVASLEEGTNRPPATVRSVGVSRIEGRFVRAWSNHFGSYGQAAPGFFELLLEGTPVFPPEHFVLTVWGASDWLTLDGRWLCAHKDQYGVQRPLFSDWPAPSNWDEVTPILVGSTLKSLTIDYRSTQLEFERPTSTHVLELSADPSVRPAFTGNSQPRTWNESESLLDAWVVTTHNLVCAE
jgi:hypothetical protein